MLKFVRVVAAVLCVVGFCVGWVVANGQNDVEEGFQISIAPSAIVLGSPVDEVTVHSKIPAAAVVDGSVALNGVAVTSVWADDTGCLAGRIAIAALPGIAPPSATFTLTAELIDGTAVAASDTVKVVESNRK